MPKLNLALLRASLSECHLTNDTKKLKLLSDVKDPSYFLHRIMECVSKCEQGEEVAENSKLGIQLFNIYRVQTCGPIKKQVDPKPPKEGETSTHSSQEATSTGDQSQ